MRKMLRSGLILFFALQITNIVICTGARAQSQNDLVATDVTMISKSPGDFTNPQPTASRAIELNYVNDYENIYTENELQFLKVLVMDFERKTSIQINIVTFDFSMIVKNDSSAVAFSFPDNLLAEQTGNNKVIVKICVDRRMIQIDPIGKNDKLISPHQSRKIINSAFLPFFQKRKIFEGSINGLKALMKELKSKQFNKD